MAESKAADGGGNQADQKRNENEDALRGAGIDGEGLQGHHREQKDDRQPGQQNIQRDFVGSFLARGSFDQPDHAIEKGFAGIGGDAHLDFVGEHACAAGHGGAVAARFANDRSGLAGDGGLIDGRDAFDDFAIARNKLSGGYDDDIAGAQLGAGDHFDASRPGADGWLEVSARALRSVSAWALPRPSAMASAKLAKRTVNQSHKVICRPKPNCPACCRASQNQSMVVRSAPTSTTNITGFLTMVRGSSL